MRNATSLVPERRSSTKSLFPEVATNILQYSHTNAICGGTEVDSDVISGRNVNTIEDYIESKQNIFLTAAAADIDDTIMPNTYAKN